MQILNFYRICLIFFTKHLCVVLQKRYTQKFQKIIYPPLPLFNYLLPPFYTFQFVDNLGAKSKCVAVEEDEEDLEDDEDDEDDDNEYIAGSIQDIEWKKEG